MPKTICILKCLMLFGRLPILQLLFNCCSFLFCDKAFKKCFFRCIQCAFCSNSICRRYNGLKNRLARNTLYLFSFTADMLHNLYIFSKVTPVAFCTCNPYFGWVCWRELQHCNNRFAIKTSACTCRLYCDSVCILFLRRSYWHSVNASCNSFKFAFCCLLHHLSVRHSQLFSFSRSYQTEIINSLVYFVNLCHVNSIAYLLYF